MRRRVYVDDLIDAREVAELLGMTNPRAVSNYRARHRDDVPPFPPPVIDKGPRQAMLWVRGDIERWQAKRAGNPAKRRT